MGKPAHHGRDQLRRHWREALVSIPSAILVTAPGTMTLHFTPSAAPSSATTLDRPIIPALATP